ncbi:MAG: DUF2244 domain-containing protein [Pseudomonadales bacterium]
MNIGGHWYKFISMVKADIDDCAHTGRIILKPNASLRWRANLCLLYTLMGISLSIGFGFLLLGAWLVLPYSLLEMAFLALCMTYCVRQCNRQEVITISEHEVLIERGISGPSEHWNYQRMWAKFMVKAPRHPWDPAVVAIRSHGKELEIGSFLSRRDKSALIEQLRRVVAGYSGVGS